MLSNPAPPLSTQASSAVFDTWQREPLSAADFESLATDSTRRIDRPQLLHLLEYSVAAPSTHNSVPQAYRIDLERSRIELHLRRDRVLPASDPTGEEALISIGCALENLVIAAALYGIRSDWHPNPDLSWGDVLPSTQPLSVRIGAVELHPGGAAPDGVIVRAALSNVLDRRTVRAEFDGAERLPETLRTRLDGSVQPELAVRLDVFESARDKFAWGKLDESATKHKLEERAFQVELGAWLLPNEDLVSVRGMRGREFGLDDRVTRELSAELRGVSPMAVDRLAFLARAGRHGLCSSSAVCVVSCLEHTPDAAVRAGRVFQRCGLLARAEGLACAVHTAVCQVPHARAMSQATMMPHRTTPSVVFRLGKPRHPADWTRPHSSRPHLEELLIAD
jgi:hypothetical protein